jgi:CRISPR-associated endoribonuclease Cas6
LKNRGAYIPFHHQYLLSQMIKGVLLHGGNEQYANSSSYNFSGLKGQTKVSRKGLHYYSSRVTLVISGIDKGFLDYLVASIFNFPDLHLGNLQLVPELVEQEEPIQFSDSMKYICISPLVIMEPSFNNDEGKRFVEPITDEFSDMLYETTMARMEAIGGYTEEQLTDFFKFQVVPDKAYIDRLTDQKKKFARIYPVFDNDIKYEVRGYTFPFTLYAAKEVQEFIFHTGLGAFTHKGFGMVDLAHVDPVARVVKYEHSYA